MIITLIVVGLFIICLIVTIILHKTENLHQVVFPMFTLLIVFGIGCFFILFGICNEHINQDLKLKKWQAQRDAIVYQMENKQYLGDALGEFNSELVYKQWYHENPFFSWFEGDYIMKIEPIELEGGKKK